MERIVLTYGFIVLLVTVVLRYGGTDPVAMSGVQAGSFLLTTAALWHKRMRESFLRPVFLAPLFLTAYVGLQWLILVESRYIIGLHVPRLLAYICAFAIAFFIGQDRNLRWHLVLALLALGVFEALYGLVQYLTGWHQIFSYRKIFYTAQASGTYINPNHFAGFLAMVLPVSLSIALHRLGRVWRSGDRLGASHLLKSEKAPRIGFYFLVSLMLFLGILFSRSRMGIFSALAAVLGVILLWGSGSWERSHITSVMLVFALAASGVGMWVGLEPVIARYESISKDYVLRESIWKDTLELIRAQPILGSGLGTFETQYPRSQTVALTKVVDHAHNDYLQFTAELGLLGAVFLFSLIFAALVRMVASLRRVGLERDRFLLLGCTGSLLAIVFHSLADFNLQIPANAIVFSTLLGLGCALAGQDAPRHSHPHQSDGK